MAPAKKEKARPELPTGVSLPASLAAVVDGLSLGSSEQGSDIPYYIPTGSSLINYIIGRPGIPAGRLTTIIGKEGGAKSTLLQTILKNTQEMGGIAVLADAERRFSRDRAERIGLNLDELLFLKSRTLEKVFADMEELVQRIRGVDKLIPITIGLDSLSALPSGKVIEEDIEKVLPALVARFCSMSFPRLIPWFGDNNVTVVIINQLRKHLSMEQGPRNFEVRKVMGQSSAMIAENSLVYWSSVILHMTQSGKLGDKEEPDGIEVRVSNKKNSVGPESKEAEINCMFLDGIDSVHSDLMLLERLGVVKQVSGWYEYPPLEKKFRSYDFAAVLEARPELKQLIKEAPLLWINGGGDAPVQSEED